MRALLILFICSLFYFASAVAGQAIFESEGVKLEYDSDKGTYDVYKDGKKDSTRIIQNFKDITRMIELVKKLGGTPNDELALTLNNNLMKSLEGPSTEQLTEVGVNQLELISSIATAKSSSTESCPLQNENPPLAFNSASKKKGWFCAAPKEEELSDDWDAQKAAENLREKRTFLDRWIGGNVTQRAKTDTYNDNFLHGGGIVLFGEQRADDRARTFGSALEYEAEGDEGSFRIRYENQLFTRLSPDEGKYGYQDYWTDDGRLKLDAMEETTLSLRGTRNFTDDKDTYAIGSLSFRERTDENRGAQSIQDFWHESSGSVMYEYKEFMDDEYSLEAKVGLGKRFEGDLGSWKCRANVEALAGVDMWTMDRAELEINASVGLDSGSWGGREKDNPWLAIDGYTRQSIDTEGLYEGMYGAKVSTSFKWGESSIRPYLGVEYYDEESDRMFQSGNEGNELIHTVGIEVSF